jgi:hypothetical protein
MSNVFMWLDKDNFWKFIKGKDFIGWSNESNHEHVQISVPPIAICTYEYLDQYNGIKFNCYKKEMWSL